MVGSGGGGREVTHHVQTARNVASVLVVIRNSIEREGREGGREKELFK